MLLSCVISLFVTLILVPDILLHRFDCIYLWQAPFSVFMLSSTPPTLREIQDEQINLHTLTHEQLFVAGQIWMYLSNLEATFALPQTHLSHLLNTSRYGQPAWNDYCEEIMGQIGILTFNMLNYNNSNLKNVFYLNLYRYYKERHEPQAVYILVVGRRLYYHWLLKYPLLHDHAITASAQSNCYFLM